MPNPYPELFPTVKVTTDDYDIIQMAQEVLGVSEERAVTALLEIGLNNILDYPTQNPRVNAILEKDNWPELVKRLKAIWTV